MLAKTFLAILWSLNGPLEKRLMQQQIVTAEEYAATKALCVTLGYAVARKPIRLGAMLSHPAAWVLVIVSTLNTPVYANVVATEHPATALPIVAATSHILRLLWMQLAMRGDAPPLTVHNMCGIVLVVAGGFLLA